jgi:hypothetical protein
VRPRLRWIPAFLIVGGLLGFLVGERSYPSHDDMRQMTSALIPGEAHNVFVGEIDGWEPLVGAYRTHGSYQGGGWTVPHLQELAISLATEQGWSVGEAIDHPGAIEIPIRKSPVQGTMHVQKPPLDFGGRVQLTYDEGVVDRPWVGAVIGAIAGLSAWGTLGVRRRLRKRAV